MQQMSGLTRNGEIGISQRTQPQLNVVHFLQSRNSWHA